MVPNVFCFWVLQSSRDRGITDSLSDHNRGLWSEHFISRSSSRIIKFFIRIRIYHYVIFESCAIVQMVTVKIVGDPHTNVILNVFIS